MNESNNLFESKKEYPQIPLMNITGMTTKNERQFLLDYARDSFIGEGEVVDLGCWIGSLTVSLLLGLQQNKKAPDAKIHAYDSFKWMPWMDDCMQKARFAHSASLQHTLLPEFIRQVFPYDKKDQVLIYSGDVIKIGWSGKPIEILSVDLMKNWELSNFVLGEFYKNLIPGRSIVFHQDFDFHLCGWIHLIQYALRDYFEPYCDIEGSYGFVFKNTQKIPDEILQKGFSFSDFSDAQVDEAFKYCEDILTYKTPRRLSEIRTARCMIYHTDNQSERALEMLEEVNASQSLVPQCYDPAKEVLLKAIKKS